jgi:hypothetical protein
LHWPVTIAPFHFHANPHDIATRERKNSFYLFDEMLLKRSFFINLWHYSDGAFCHSLFYIFSFYSSHRVCWAKWKMRFFVHIHDFTIEQFQIDSLSLINEYQFDSRHTQMGRWYLIEQKTPALALVKEYFYIKYSIIPVRSVNYNNRQEQEIIDMQIYYFCILFCCR